MIRAATAARTTGSRAHAAHPLLEEGSRSELFDLVNVHELHNLYSAGLAPGNTTDAQGRLHD
jgi:hypothetical protein